MLALTMRDGESCIYMFINGIACKRIRDGWMSCDGKSIIGDRDDLIKRWVSVDDVRVLLTAEETYKAFKTPEIGDTVCYRSRFPNPKYTYKVKSSSPFQIKACDEVYPADPNNVICV